MSLFVIKISSAQTTTSIDLFTVSPTTYSHLYGGGILGEKLVEGGFQGSRTQLSGPQFACGDYISTFIVVHGGLDANQDELTVRLQLDQKANISRGAALSLAQAPRIHRGEIIIRPVGVREDSNAFRPDPASIASDESTVTIIGQHIEPTSMNDQRFDADYEIITLKFTGLDAGERLIGRLDLELKCAPNSRPRGSLSVQLISAEQQNGESIRIDTNSIEIRNIEGTKGIGEPLPRTFITPLNDSRRCPTVNEMRRTPSSFEALTIEDNTTILYQEYCIITCNFGNLPLLEAQLTELEPENLILAEFSQLNPSQEVHKKHSLALDHTTLVSVELSGGSSISNEKFIDRDRQLFLLITTGDADGDGLRDQQELSLGTDIFSVDSDEDGLSDYEEYVQGSDPLDADCDDDGLIDGLEGSIEAIYNHDTDGDGLFDGTERGVNEPHLDTDLSQDHFRPDLDPDTLSDHTRVDSDGGGCPDHEEDPNLNGRFDPGEADVINMADDLDEDGDGLCDVRERSLGSDPNDGDSDDDGLNDGLELSPELDSDGDGLNNINDPDSDNDGLSDGLELGLAFADPDTNLSLEIFAPDQDPSSTTDPLLADTDGGGILDGIEDYNHNGKLDQYESNPNLFSDDEEDLDLDQIPPSLDNCPLDNNPDQADQDNDGFGDLCDEDIDGNLVFDGLTPQRAHNCDQNNSSYSPFAPIVFILLYIFLYKRQRLYSSCINSKVIHLVFFFLTSIPSLSHALPLVEERYFRIDALQIDDVPSGSPGELSGLKPQGLWGIRLGGSFGDRAIVLSQELGDGESQEIATLLKFRSDMTLSTWIKINDHWVITSALPITLFQGRDDLSGSLPTPAISETLAQIPNQALGDLQFSFRRYVTLTPSLKLALGMLTTVPTGSKDSYSAEKRATYGVLSALTYEYGSAQINLSLQHRLRPLVNFIGHERQDLSQASLGGSWLFHLAQNHFRSGVSFVGQSDVLSRQELLGGPHYSVWTLIYLSYHLKKAELKLWGAHAPIQGLSTPEWMSGITLSMHFDEVPFNSWFEKNEEPQKELPPNNSENSNQPIISEALILSKIDSDGDKILDDVDLCPHQAGVLITEGCPSHDMDGDSVDNQIDACPWSIGSKSNYGCPIDEIAVPLKLRKPFIFDFGALTLTKAQNKEHARLKQLATFLRLNPNIIAHLSGHTDYKGQKSWNMQVSYKRVLYIKKSLLQSGVDSKQIEVSAFGEDEPLVYDSLHTQRLLNRRVSVTYRLRAPLNSVVNSKELTDDNK